MEEYHRLLPFVVTFLVALRMVGLLHHMEVERKKNTQIVLVAYGVPKVLNTFAWGVTAFIEVRN